MSDRNACRLKCKVACGNCVLACVVGCTSYGLAVTAHAHCFFWHKHQIIIVPLVFVTPIFTIVLTHYVPVSIRDLLTLSHIQLISHHRREKYRIANGAILLK